MQAVLLNVTYGFTTTSSVPKRRQEVNTSKAKGIRTVGLQKEINVAQARADGTVIRSALANELKAAGVTPAVPPHINQVCFLRALFKRRTILTEPFKSVVPKEKVIVSIWYGCPGPHNILTFDTGRGS